MARKTARPKRFHVGPIAIRVVRGPHKDDANSWYWRATAEEEGRRWNVWTGWGTVQQAQAEVAALLAANDGSAPLPAAKTQAARAKGTEVTTVRDLLECFAARQRERHEAGDLTKYGYRNSRNDARNLVAGLGSIKLDRLDGAHIEGYRNASLKAGAASASVHRTLKSLRAAWAWGRSRGLTPVRDLPKVTIKVTAVRDKHTPSHADVQAVIEAMRAGSWFRWVTEILAATGARVGEIAELTWEAIDWRNNAFVLTGKGESRSFPITDEIKDILDAAPNQGPGHLHGTTVSMVRGHYSSRELKRACEQAHVKRFSAHGLRRAAVDALARSGVDIGTAADLIGHSPEVMLRAYRQVSAADRRAAAGALSAARKGAKIIPFPKASKG